MHEEFFAIFNKFWVVKENFFFFLTRIYINIAMILNLDNYIGPPKNLMTSFIKLIKEFSVPIWIKAKIENCTFHKLGLATYIYREQCYPMKRVKNNFWLCSDEVILVHINRYLVIDTKYVYICCIYSLSLSMISKPKIFT